MDDVDTRQQEPSPRRYSTFQFRAKNLGWSGARLVKSETRRSSSSINNKSDEGRFSVSIYGQDEESVDSRPDFLDEQPEFSKVGYDHCPKGPHWLITVILLAREFDDTRALLRLVVCCDFECFHVGMSTLLPKPNFRASASRGKQTDPWVR